jgi:hypothetical protein
VKMGFLKCAILEHVGALLWCLTDCLCASMQR